MITLIYMTDPHIRGNNPRGRIDNFPEALKTKLREIYQIAAREQAQAIICGGDLFDRPDTAYAVAGEFAAVLAESPVPIYVVPGNHEVYGYNLDSVPRSVLGLMARVGLVTILNRVPVVLSESALSIQITGQGFYADMDRNPIDYRADVTAAGINYKVHVVHGMLVERPLPYEVRHTLIEDVQTDADVILAGHEHIGFGLRQRKDGVWFCNPGALGRLAARVEEIHRTVQVAVFRFTEAGINAELVPLESARPGTEVLSRDHIAEAAEREEKMNRFLGLLAEEGEARFLDIREIVDGISEREKLPEAVRNEALARLARAREELGVAV